MVGLGGVYNPLVRAKTLQEAQNRRRYAFEYLKDFNATGAARRCGFSSNKVKNIHAYHTGRLVQEEIEKVKQEMEKEAKLTILEVIERLRRLADMAETDGRYEAAVKATELLGKHLAMFTEKVEADLRTNNPFWSGDSEEARLRDIKTLKSIAAPALTENGNEETTDGPSE